MRRWKIPFIVAGVIGLLSLFLWLQWSWLLRANEAERDRMQKRVKLDTDGFADDFNREIQAAYFNFQMDDEGWKDPAHSEFIKRFDYWKEHTEYPNLISGFAFVSAADRSGYLDFDRETKTFTRHSETDEIASIRAEIDAAKGPNSILRRGKILVVPAYEADKTFGKIVVRNIRSAKIKETLAAEPFGRLLVFIDQNVLTDQVLPKLTAKHFGDDGFVVSVVDTNGTTIFGKVNDAANSDGSAGLYDLSPDKFIFFSKSDVAFARTKAPTGDVVFDRRVESRTLTKKSTEPGENDKTFKIEVQTGQSEPAKTTVLSGSTTDVAPWKLLVEHKDGSIDAYLKNERNKSFVVGLAIYLLLVGSIVAIVLSAYRAKRFAERQIDFVSSVSHEFRTPLAVIYSAGENLADGIANDREQVLRYGELIKGEGSKLSQMVEQILEFAGARSGRKKYHFAPVYLQEVINDSVAECSEQAVEDGFLLETDITSGLPIIDGDHDGISAAVQNLIRNSLKYSNGSRWIKVSAANDDRHVTIAVEDKGIGIAASDLRHIFEPFYRAKDVVDAQIHGSGLGLSLVKETVEAHGGSVRAESEVGKGSKFVIELPHG